MRGLEKQREGAETQLRSPENSLSSPAVTSLPTSCIPPSVCTPSSPSVQSYPSHPKTWPPLPKGVSSQNPGSTNSPHHPPGDWPGADFPGSLLSPQPVSEFLGSRAWVSYLCVSQQDTAARYAPYHSPLPLSPTPTGVISLIRPLRVFHKDYMPTPGHLHVLFLIHEHPFSPVSAWLNHTHCSRPSMRQ